MLVGSVQSSTVEDKTTVRFEAGGTLDGQERVYTGIIEREGDVYVALCPELDVASQGVTVEEATGNLREAVELFLECASPEEIKERLHTEVFVTRFEAAHG
jgi:predicted RNase H-like HicB family nuclease